jgi:hypothetical protein
MSMATACHESIDGEGEIQRVERVSESKERVETPARSTTTSTVAVDDLTEARELPGGGFSSAKRQRAPEEVRGVERKQMRGRGGFQRASPAYIKRGWVWSTVVSIESDWMARAVSGDGVVSQV